MVHLSIISSNFFLWWNYDLDDLWLEDISVTVQTGRIYLSSHFWLLKPDLPVTSAEISLCVKCFDVKSFMSCIKRIHVCLSSSPPSPPCFEPPEPLTAKGSYRFHGRQRFLSTEVTDGTRAHLPFLIDLINYSKTRTRMQTAPWAPLRPPLAQTSCVSLTHRCLQFLRTSTCCSISSKQQRQVHGMCLQPGEESLQSLHHVKRQGAPIRRNVTLCLASCEISQPWVLTSRHLMESMIMKHTGFGLVWKAAGGKLIMLCRCTGW